LRRDDSFVTIKRGAGPSRPKRKRRKNEELEAQTSKGKGYPSRREEQKPFSRRGKSNVCESWNDLGERGEGSLLSAERWHGQFDSDQGGDEGRDNDCTQAGPLVLISRREKKGSSLGISLKREEMPLEDRVKKRKI